MVYDEVKLHIVGSRKVLDDRGKHIFFPRLGHDQVVDEDVDLFVVDERLGGARWLLQIVQWGGEERILFKSSSGKIWGKESEEREGE